jgi:hypothetical protein
MKMSITRNRLRWSVVLNCKNEFSQLKNIQSFKKKNFLKDNRHILKHESMTCVLIDDELATFSTIHRNEKKLFKKLVIVIVQFANDSTLSFALFKMKIAEDVKLTQLDVSTFVFESFLRRLQKTKILSLKNELFHWKIDKDIEKSFFQSIKMIKIFESRSEKSLKNVLRINKNIILNQAQMNSFCVWLFQRVSLMQDFSDDWLIYSIILSLLTRTRDEKILHWNFNDENHSWLHVKEDSRDLFHESCIWSISWRFDEHWNLINSYDSTEKKVHRSNEISDDSKADQWRTRSNSMKSDRQNKKSIKNARDEISWCI